MIDLNDFIHGTYMDIHYPYMHNKYFAYMAYILNVMAIFVSATCMLLWYAVSNTVGGILALMFIDVRSLCSIHYERNLAYMYNVAAIIAH